MAYGDEIAKVMMAGYQPQTTNPYAGTAQSFNRSLAYDANSSIGENIGASFVQGFAGGLFGQLSREREQKIQNETRDYGFQVAQMAQSLNYDELRQNEAIKADYRAPRTQVFGDTFFEEQDGKMVPSYTLSDPNKVDAWGNPVTAPTVQRVTAPEATGQVAPNAMPIVEPQSTQVVEAGPKAQPAGSQIAGALVPQQVATATPIEAIPNTPVPFEQLDKTGQTKFVLDSMRQQGLSPDVAKSLLPKRIEEIDATRQSLETFDRTLTRLESAHQLAGQTGTDPVSQIKDWGKWSLSGLNEDYRKEQSARDELRALGSEQFLSKVAGVGSSVANSNTEGQRILATAANADQTPEQRANLIAQFKAQRDAVAREYARMTGQAAPEAQAYPTIADQIAPEQAAATPQQPQKVLPEQESAPLGTAIAGAIIDPKLSAAVQQVESANNPNAVSPKGARGLMQVMPATFKEVAKRYGIKADIDDPQANKMVGELYLAEQLETFKGNASLATAAYNSGPGTVKKTLKRAGIASPEEIQNTAWEEIAHLSPQSKENRAETLGYVKKIGGLLVQDAIAEEQAQVAQVPVEQPAVAQATPQAQPPQTLGQRVSGALRGSYNAVKNDPYGAAANVANGATFGFADEAIGLVSPTGRAAYEKSRDDFKKANPGTALAAETLGGFVPGGMLLKGAKTVGGAIKLAAMEGGAYGLGDSKKENVGQAISDTIEGGAVGGLTAGLVGAGGKAALGSARLTKVAADKAGVTDFINRAQQRLGGGLGSQIGAVGADLPAVGKKGASKVIEPLANADARRGVKTVLQKDVGLTVDQAEEIRSVLKEAKDLGVKDLTIADVLVGKGDDGGTMVSRAARNFSPDKSKNIGRKLTERAEGAYGRTEGILDELTPQRDTFDAAEKLKETVAERIKTDQKLRSELASPEYKKTWLAHPRIKKDLVQDMHKFKAFRSAVNQAREWAGKAPLEKGAIETNTKILHQARRYLDDQIASATSAVTGVQKTQAARLQELRKSLDSALDVGTGGKIKKADEAFKRGGEGTLASIDDQRLLDDFVSPNDPSSLVRQFVNKTPGEVERFIKALGPEGEEAVVGAVRSALSDTISRKRVGQNVVSQITGIPKVEEQLRRVLGPEKYSKIMRKLEFEDLMAKSKNATNAGSSTAGNLNQMGGLSSSLGEAAGALGDIISAVAMPSPQTAAKAAGRLSSLTSLGSKGTKQKGWEGLADTLFDQEQGLAVMDWYIKQIQKEAKGAATRGKYGSAAALSADRARRGRE